MQSLNGEITVAAPEVHSWIQSVKASHAERELLVRAHLLRQHHVSNVTPQKGLASQQHQQAIHFLFRVSSTAFQHLTYGQILRLQNLQLPVMLKDTAMTSTSITSKKRAMFCYSRCCGKRCTRTTMAHAFLKIYVRRAPQCHVMWRTSAL